MNGIYLRPKDAKDGGQGLEIEIVAEAYDMTDPDAPQDEIVGKVVVEHHDDVLHVCVERTDEAMCGRVVCVVP